MGYVPMRIQPIPRWVDRSNPAAKAQIEAVQFAEVAENGLWIDRSLQEAERQMTRYETQIEEALSFLRDFYQRRDAAIQPQ